MRSTDRFVTDADRCRLGNLLTSREGQAWGNQRRRSKLYSFLEDAVPIKPCDAPETLITMNTTIELVDLKSGARRVVTLVYPRDLDLVPDGVSVLKPLGVALIGCQIGDVIEWSEGNRRHRMRVAKIVHQPEYAEMWHL